MKRKFEELRENLEEFVEQTDYPVLIVGCLRDELAYVFKILQGMDQQYPQNLFAMFPQPFLSPSAYVDAMVESLKVQLVAAEQMRKEKGEPPPPPLPLEVTDPHRRAGDRLQSLLLYLKSLLPNEQDHAVVVGLLPLACKDPDEYSRLIATILPAEEVPDWMAPLRIVAYDDRSSKRLIPVLQANKVDTVLTYEIDFSTPALTDALSRDAANTSLPVAERMSCLMQLAALDYSYKRYPDALEKYQVLFEFYRDPHVPAMQALCLLGTGDTLRASGLADQAKTMLQRGAALAIEHKLLAPLLNLLLSLVEVCFELEHYEDAESYADSGTQVASGLVNPYARADFLEKKGDAELKQGKAKPALESYGACRELSEKIEYFPRCKSVLNKLIALYGQTNGFVEKHEAEREIERVEALERSGGSGANALNPAQAPGAAS